MFSYICTAVDCGREEEQDIKINSYKPEEKTMSKLICKVISTKKTLCLNMIVKNEASIIIKSLESVKDYIDYWVICDMGSTDNTTQLIKEFFEKYNISGELYYTPWKDFGYNCTVALKLARGKSDYILLMDADMSLVVKDKLFKEKLVKDAYSILCNGMKEVKLVSGLLEFQFEGKVRESLNICKRCISECDMIEIETINSELVVEQA